MFQHKSIFIAITFLVLIAGCSMPSNAPRLPTQWLTHQATLSKIDHFTAKGKVAFISPKERVTARFIWKQNGDKLSLRVINFLGTTLFTLETTANSAMLVDNQGQQHLGPDAKILLERLTGILLPVDEMVQWIKGLPTEQNSFTLGKDNRLAALSQHDSSRFQPGWQVDYRAYDPKTNNLLPSTINMHQQLQKVNLVISEWIYTP